MTTFKEMSFNEKREHIWEYYKVHIIATVIALFFLGSMLNLYVFNPPPDIILDMSFRVPQYDYDETQKDALVATLTEAVVKTPKTEAVQVELLQTDGGIDPSVTMAVEAKFMGKAEVEQLDLIVTDKDGYDYMRTEGFFVDLAILETQTGITLPEHLKVYEKDPETGADVAWVMDADAMPGLKAIFRDKEKDYYVGLFVRSVAEDNAMKALARLSQ